MYVILLLSVLLLDINSIFQTESVRSRASDVDTENYESDMDTYDEMTDAKYEVIVAKLEKLDKLDELLRKLDTMKVCEILGSLSFIY